MRRPGENAERTALASLSFARPNFANKTVEEVEHKQRDHKNDPPPGEMEEALGLFRIPVLHEESGADDAHAIGEDCDGYGNQSKQNTHRGSLLQQVAVDHRQCDE